MELSGVVSRRIPCLRGGLGAGSRRAGLPCGQRRDFCRVSMRFRDEEHMKYYSEGARCGGGKVEKSAKKKLKLIKGLYRELSMFSRMGFGIDEGSGLVGELHEKRISPVDTQEAAEVLLSRLKQLKSEEKELKKRRKQEKARAKAERMKRSMDPDSSSSSSESSDSETDEVIDMNRLRIESPTQKVEEQPEPFTQGTTVPSALTTSELSSTVIPSPPSNTTVGPEKRIEVCMGGKCRKSGGAALLEELQRAVGIEGATVGCKCMGKCRDGPNVRVCNGARLLQREDEGDSAVRVSAPLNPLCIGVGLEDVGAIVANFLGTEQNGLDVGFQPAG